jgi:hypothetical protein
LLLLSTLLLLIWESLVVVWAWRFCCNFCCIWKA